MLCAKRKQTVEIVTAYFANKSQAPFSCPDCGDPVILKSGRSKVRYFAHENSLACRFSGGESEAHENCKWEIFEALQRHAEPLTEAGGCDQKIHPRQIVFLENISLAKGFGMGRFRRTPRRVYGLPVPVKVVRIIELGAARRWFGLRLHR